MIPTTPIVPGEELPVNSIAEHQDEYQTLPAYRSENGIVLTRWKMSLKERLRALFYGDVYLLVWTFNRPLQPVKLQVEKPEVIYE